MAQRSPSAPLKVQVSPIQFNKWVKARAGYCSCRTQYAAAPRHSATARRVDLRTRCAGPPVILVAIMASHPVGEITLDRFMATFGHDIEPVIDGQKHLTSAAIGGISVVNRSFVILVEDAHAR